MEASAFKKLQPFEYHRRHIENLVRADGRCLHNARRCVVSDGDCPNADASFLVRLGSTAVLAGVIAQVGPPADPNRRPKDGQITISVDIPCLASAQSRSGPPPDIAMAYTSRLQAFLQSCSLISPSELCIEEGRSVWHLQVDLVCLEDDGCVFDACVLALVGVLRRLQLPEHIALDEERKLVYGATDGPKQKLSVPHWYAAVTVLLYKPFEDEDDDEEEDDGLGLGSGGATKPKLLYLLDPTSDEIQSLCPTASSVSSTRLVTAILRSDGQLAQMYSAGGMHMESDDDFDQALLLCRARGQRLFAMVKEWETAQST